MQVPKRLLIFHLIRNLQKELSRVEYCFLYHLQEELKLPVLQDFFSIKVEGITDEIYKPVTDIFPDDKVSGDYYS